MNFYEIMYIVHPILEMGRLHDLIIETENIIKEKGGGDILFTKVIGKKRMAYPIQKQKFGNYVLVQYKSNGLKNNEFGLDLEHNPNILRHMIINILESEINEHTEDIKDQISGLSRTNSSKQTEDKIDTEKIVLEETREQDIGGSEKTQLAEVEEAQIDNPSTIVGEETISVANTEKEE